MASSIQDIEFLDLTDVDEADRIHLQQVLFTVIPNLELPWEVKNEIHFPSQGFEPPPFAVAPIPQPSLRAAFVPQPLYSTAPAAVVGVVPSFPGGEPPNGPPLGLIPAMESLECNTGPIVTLDASTSPSGGPVQTHTGSDGEGQYHSESAPVALMSVPSVPSSVTQTSQPVITTMYQMVGHAGMPLSNVYVGNVTANVNVHSFVGSPLTPYSPHLPQVFPGGEVPVPNEPSNSPNSARNGIGQRRPRTNKPGGKRIDVPFGPRTPGVGHGHDVLTTVVDSPPGPPTLPPPPNYIIPVPPMHHPHPFHQSYYPAQPPHGPPHMQHPSAQHATGAPLIVPFFHPSMYNTYQPGASGPIVFSANPNIVPAHCPTTEQSSGISYPVNDGSSERMVPEGRETEVTVHEHQPVFTVEETQELKCSVNEEEKILGYRCDTGETEQCSSTNTVVVNNSKLGSDSGCKNENLELCSAQEQITDNTVSDTEQISVKSVAPNKEVPQDTKIEISEKTMIQSTNCPAEEGVESSEEKNSNTVSALNVNLKVSQLPVEQVESDVSNGFDFSGNLDSQSSKIKSNVSGGNNFNGPVESSPQSVLNHREKTWASLFDKSGANNIPSDGAMILVTGMTPNSSSKPLAAVRPFQNAVTVSSGSADASRKLPESSSFIGNSCNHFPQLGQSDVPSSPMADDPHLYRLGELLSKYQLDHRAVSVQPRGLTNRSNWCYINSTLQALLACPPFYNLLKSLSPPRKGGKSSTPIIDSMVEFVNEFSLLSSASRVNRREKAQRKDDAIEVQVGPAFEPCYIYKMLSNIQSDTFKVEGRQEDAEEFFSCLLNALNDEMLELIKLVKDPSEGTVSNGDVTNGNVNNVAFENDDTEWKVMGRKNKGSVTRRAEFVRTPVSDIFRGQLRSRVQRGGDHSDNVQPFFTLQLDIEKAQSVKEALDLLGGRDQLEGVTCSKTNQEVEAWQQVTLEELPLVLVLHLKWFNYKLDGCSKIVKTVEFPIDLKVEGKLMSSSNKYNMKQKQYKLFAVVYHDGKEATKGHYITDVYHVGYGGWVRYDDSSVKAIQENHMLHPRGSRVPYLLYYRRSDTIGGLSATPDKR